VERDRLAEITSGTHAVIDLDAYAGNIRRLRQLAGGGHGLMAIVKANAYGHGATTCAEAAIDAGCAYLGVARIDEALELRRARITAPVLVIGPANIAQLAVALEHQIALTVATHASADAVVREAESSGYHALVHLKVDTGLHRYGALPDVAVDLARKLAASRHVSLEGLYTHYASADEEDRAPTLRQFQLFERVVERLRAEDIRPPLVHVANSAAILTSQFPHTNMVRAGIATYGLDPSDEVPIPGDLRQVIAIRSVLTRRFTLAAGESVSYNMTYTALEDERVAAVPVGYADGLERHLSNTGWFVHNGRRCPIRGRVCMDQTVIGVPEDAAEGDAITILGPGEEGEMTVRTLGELCGTNTYEPVTRLAARLPRLYVRGGKPVSWAVPLLGERGYF
jgi:alanine racemase